MNATTFSPALVAPFKFPASPYEYKVMPLRECPTPEALQQSRNNAVRPGVARAIDAVAP